MFRLTWLLGWRSTGGVDCSPNIKSIFLSCGLQMNLTGMAGRICPLLVLVHSSLLDCVYTGFDLACPLVHFVYVYSFMSALWAHVPEGKKMFGIFGMQMLCNSLEARSYVCACVCMNECMYA